MHIMVIRDKKKEINRTLHSNRGSAAVISLIFMMFLLIIGVGFMPLMSSEVKHASMDMDEQQAWYAAEAGIKYAKAYATDADVIKNSIGQSIKLATNNDAVKYVLKIIDPTDPDNSVVTSSTAGFPVADRKYKVYSEGDFNGVKKVITEEMVFAKSSSSGGESGGGTSGDISSVENSFISAGGRIKIADKGITFNVSDDKTIMQSSQLVFPQRTEKWYDDSTYEQSAAKSNWWNKNTNLASSLYTYLPSSMFVIPSSAKRIYRPDNGAFNLSDGETRYVDNESLKGNTAFSVTGANSSTLYFKQELPLSSLKFWGITGPNSGEPMTIFWDGDLSLSNLSISGNVRILVNGKLTLSGGSGDGNFMFMSNGDLTVAQSMSGMKNIFLSSNNNINISGAFTGQLQAKNDIVIQGAWANLVFNSSVLKAFGLPKGATT